MEHKSGTLKPPINIKLRESGGPPLGVYADVYSVSSEEETGIVTLTFYQSEVPVSAFAMGDTTSGNFKNADFVARVVLSEKGRDALVNALTQNREAKKTGKLASATKPRK